MVISKRFAYLALAVMLCASSAKAQDSVRGAAWSVVRYELTAQPQASERALAATATISARNTGSGAGRTFTVRLNPAAEVRAASVGAAAATFTKREDTRAKLNQFTVNLPASIAVGETVSVKIDYRLPVERNTGLAAVSFEGAQMLPLANWYPTPNSVVSPRGADYAPFRLSVNSGEQVLSSGKAASGNSFEQSLNAQPFFVAGKWTTVDGESAGRGVSAYLLEGATNEEQAQARELIKLAAAARDYFATQFGFQVDAPVRLVSVRRGAGFDSGGSVLLDASSFRRARVDSATALTIADAIARMWVGGAASIGGEGAGVVREGLVRFYALQFIEKQFGVDAANAERARARAAYANIARRDAPLAQSSPLLDTYYNSVTNKGALVWRMIEQTMGRDRFARVVANLLQAARGKENFLTLASMRAALINEAGAASANVTRLLGYAFDEPTDMDLLIGTPQKRGAESVSALRNTGNLDAQVTVVATTASGEKLTASTTLPARDFGEARFNTTAEIKRVEVDPNKIYPQINYANDVAPAASAATEEPLAEATRAFARNDYAQAETKARETLARTPAMSEAVIILARSLLGANKIEVAETEFKRALDSPLPTPAAIAWANIGLGDIALRRANTAEAARRYAEAVRADAEYASTLAARNKRIEAETSAAIVPPIDSGARDFIARLDAAIKSGRRAELESFIVGGELSQFASGVVGTQPDIWQTRVLRTENAGGNRIAVDVSIQTRALGTDRQGTAVLMLARDASGALKLADIQLFEVR